MPLLDALRARTPDMLDSLDALVSAESPSGDLDAVRACADVLTAVAGKLVPGAPERVETEGRAHLLWRWGAPRVLLVGHYDTVWPLGTTRRWPFSVDGDRATGPGTFDMKAGLVQGLFALSALESLDGVALLVNADEELGSPTSRELIESTARGLRAALVLEASADGALKTARKGVSIYDIEIEGRASHAGLEPERGVNALVELSHQVLGLERIARPDLGTTVTPTVASAGTAQNVVPAQARVHLDVRASTTDEQLRVDAELRALQPKAGAAIKVLGKPNRPPMQESSSKVSSRSRRGWPRTSA